MINDPYFHSNKAPYILDSKATGHIYFDLKYFSSISKIRHIMVKLPNGNVAIADYPGTINVSSNLKMHDVPYWP